VARVANWAGQSSRYVLNPASAWGLSFDTRGRESERRIPSMSYKSVIVPAVICAPRSEWMISSREMSHTQTVFGAVATSLGRGCRPGRR
jgi:hypothetical protein